MKINSIFVLLPSIFFWFDSQAFLWSDKSFEECMVREMKGRDDKQRDLVEDLCYTKFPVLSSLKNKKVKKQVYCLFPNGSRSEVNVEENYFGAFKITHRTKDSIEGLKDNMFGKLSGKLFLDLSRGTGTIYNTSKIHEYISFRCYEK